MEMVKTIAKPIFNWVISTDNDAVMEKFTNRMLPETQYRGHHDKLAIASHARQGNGEEVWRTTVSPTRSVFPDFGLDPDFFLKKSGKSLFFCPKSLYFYKMATYYSILESLGPGQCNRNIFKMF